MDWTIVFKALGPLTTRAVTAAAPTVTRSWRVAFETKRRAKKSGIRVKLFALRRFIDDHNVLDLFNDPISESMEAIAPALRTCIQGQSTPDTVTALLAFMASAYVHSLPASQASRFEGEATRKHVTSEVSQLHERNAETLEFEANCDKLNPFRAADARRLLPQWSKLPRAVAAIVTAEDRAQLLEDWLANRPSWLVDIPASVLCWLSSTAEDYGASNAAQQFLSEALVAGASPHAYWKAKSALLAPMSLAEAEAILKEARGHPLGAALGADLRAEWETAIKEIRAWEPVSHEDQAMKRQVLAQWLTATGDLDHAIDVAIEGYIENRSPGCAVYAAKLLLGRGSLRQHPTSIADLARGLELADAARTSIRSWGGESSEAVLTMIAAYTLLGSPEQALRTGTAEPDGTATAKESADARVLTETAKIAAELGLTEKAREITLRMPPGPGKDHVEALLTEAEFGFEAAIPQWAKALTSITDAEDILNIGLRLAHNGQAADWPAWIMNDFSAEVADIDLISELFREVPGTLPKARARAGGSRQVFHGLMSFHFSRKEYSAAAEVAEDGAMRWNDPESWLSAAQSHLKAEDQERAIAAAEEAIRVGGSAWLGARKARAILIETRSAKGQWDKALIEATRLLETDSENISAKWAFLTCQFMTSDYQGAWNSFVRLGAPPPKTPDDARIWLQLHTRYAPDPEYLDQAAALAERWPENEQLRAGIVLSVMHAIAQPETDDQVRQYQELISRFVADYPDSSHLWVISVDENNPFESIKDMLPDPENLEKAQRPILNGRVPLGLATRLSGKSYAEICLVRGAGKVFAGNPVSLDDEVDIVISCLDKRVVIDTTALSTFALLGADLAREWLGVFSSGVVPTEAIHDAQRAVLSLSAMSTATIGIDKTTGGPKIHEITESEAARRLENATTLLTIARELASVPHPEITEIPRLKSTQRDHQWILSLDLAKKLGLPFWCDDRALRMVAEAVGVKSFGTPALLESFRRSGHESPEIVDAYEAKLIHHYYTGIRFEPSVMELAAQMDSWRPLGTAASISDSGPTASPDQQINFALRALRRCAGNPEDVQVWVASVTSWLYAVSPDVATATDNVRAWFSTLLREEWINSSSLPQVLAGLRSAGGEEIDLVALVPDVLIQFYADLAGRTNHAVASEYVLELTRLAPNDYRSGVLRGIISL